MNYYREIKITTKQQDTIELNEIIESNKSMRNKDFIDTENKNNLIDKITCASCKQIIDNIIKNKQNNKIALN